MQYHLEKGSVQAVVETHGGELVSLQNAAGTEYIGGGDPAFWTGRNPNLFPIVGSLRGNQTKINGEIYEMFRHGFTRNSEFTLIEQTPDSAVLELRETPETLRRYPFPFALRIRHRLLEDGFSTTYTVENTGSDSLPFCIGGHTAIRCPLFPGERFEDYQLVFEVSEDAETLLLTPEGLIDRTTEPMMKDGIQTLDYETFRRLDTIIFRDLQSNSVSLVHRETGHGVKLDFHEFPAIGFWTPPGAPFLCMEPWHGCAGRVEDSDQFLEKPFLIRLHPGEQKRLTYTFTFV